MHSPNNETLKKVFLPFAITSIDQIQFGVTYYTAFSPKGFKIRALLTKRESALLDEIPIHQVIDPHSNEILWYLRDNTGLTESLRDTNIPPNNYNSWLMFDDKEIFEMYQKARLG